MNWFNILKELKLLTQEEISAEMEGFESPTSKGYPEVVSPMMYIVKIQNGEIVGYSAFKDMGTFRFVGNNYLLPKARRQGIYPDMMAERDKYVEEPRIALVNPIDGSSEERLVSLLKKRGAYEIKNYSQVEDIMTQDTYSEMSIKRMFRYR